MKNGFFLSINQRQRRKQNLQCILVTYQAQDRKHMSLPFLLNFSLIQLNTLGNLYYIQILMEMASQPNNQDPQLSIDNQELLQGNITQNSKNQGPWTNSQQKKYIVFLEYFKKVLQNRQKRKNFKIFKEMAKFIISRDGIQCRSHHMKLLRTHSKIRKIISHFKKELNFSPQTQPEFQQLKNTKSPSNQLEEKPRIKKQVQSSCIFPEQQKVYTQSIGSTLQIEQQCFIFNQTAPHKNPLTFSMSMPVLLYSPVFFIQGYNLSS